MGAIAAVVAQVLPLLPRQLVWAVGRRYIAGAELSDAVRCAATFAAQGIRSTLDVLGEFVTDWAQAQQYATQASEVLQAIAQHQLPAYLSVKLTALGVDIDREASYGLLRGLVEQARQLGLFVRIDMESSPYTDTTFAFYRRLRGEGYDNVGIVIQAYLRRSRADVESLLPLRPSIRLCKGIYIEPREIAYQSREEVRRSYKELLELMLRHDIPTAIATHDEELLRFAEVALRRYEVPPDQYEFQMLLGVRPERRRLLRQQGHPVRVYIPFGHNWYGYSLRRLRENPNIVGHILRTLLQFDRQR
ncbi:MAG: proline dehydrogenase family protein [Candidatus Kapabacteria bacterium]|nr:proline dehydrogenase family protein [Candidatus Kapabacteria bacterium]MDW8012133.1 proline dehydrogenase family protein [Bacteroidota bacterium]